MEFKNLFKATKTVPVRYGEYTFDIEYYPHRYDGKIDKTVNEYLAERGHDKIHEVITKLVRDWSITDDGKPLPVTVEVLEAFPTPMKVAIGRAIINDVWSNLTTDDSKDEDAE